MMIACTGVAVGDGCDAEPIVLGIAIPPVGPKVVHEDMCEEDGDDECECASLASCEG